jgi:hypothetical protein
MRQVATLSYAGSIPAGVFVGTRRIAVKTRVRVSQPVWCRPLRKAYRVRLEGKRIGKRAVSKTAALAGCGFESHAFR